MANQVEIFNIDFGDTIQSIEKLKAELKETRKLFEAAKPNTAEFAKYSTEVKRLDGTIKTLNAATKENQNQLGGINTAAKFAAGSYGELKQKISSQTKALNELTVGTEEFNQAQEELIQLQAQRIEVEKKIPSLFQERIKGALDESNALKQLKADLKAAQSAALNGDGAAAQRVAELKDKIDDLKDSTQTLQGSGVERLNTSMNLLTEGFANFDSDKLSTGFKGIGAAMSAIPIVLLIEGVKVLIDNFDVIVKFVRELSGGFSTAERQVTKLTRAFEQQTIVNKVLISQYDNQIALLTAQGASEEKLTEIKKKKIQVEIIEAENQLKLNSARAAQILLNKSIGDSTEGLISTVLKYSGNVLGAAAVDAKAAADRATRYKEEVDKARESAIQLSKLKNDLLVLDAEYNKKQSETAKKTSEEKKKIWEEEADAWFQNELEKQAAEHELYLKQIQMLEQADQAYTDSLNYILQKEKEYNQQVLDDNIATAQTKIMVAQRTGGDIIAARLELLKAEREQELSNTELTEAKRAEIVERYRAQESKMKLEHASNDLQIASQLTTSLIDLSDAYYTVQRNNLEKGSEEDKQAAKEQFETRKALSIVTTLINGAVAVVNAFATLPYYANIVAAAAATATTAANVATISSQKFQYFEGGYTKKGNPTQEAESIGNAQFHNDEYVIPSRVLNTPKGSLIASYAEGMRKGMANPFPHIGGFFDGGFTANSVSANSINSASMQNSLIQAISSINPIVRVTDIDKVSTGMNRAVIVSSL